MTRDVGVAFLSYLNKSSRAQDAIKAGVSPAFVSNVLEANIDEIISEMIKWAAECGEVTCPNEDCDNETYYTLKNAKLDIQGNPICPECNTTLKSIGCAKCGKPLLAAGGHHAGTVFRGYTYCHDCIAQDAHAKKELLASGSGCY